MYCLLPRDVPLPVQEPTCGLLLVSGSEEGEKSEGKGRKMTPRREDAVNVQRRGQTRPD